MSQFSGGHRDSSRTPTPTSSPPAQSGFQHTYPRQQNSGGYPDSSFPHDHHASSAAQNLAPNSSASVGPAPGTWNVSDFESSPPPDFRGPSSSSSPLRAPAAGEYASSSPAPLKRSPSASPPGRNRSSSRPLSMVQTYQPPVMDVNEDTIPELQPIFTLLNSHANKLYQEGYFLKLDDQNTHGRPNPDRTWTECFAQLVGTVLSLWDANELDAAGEDGEVLPKFINLTDASIKMIESLPTRSNSEEELRNILSISTAGRNRYLLHFNSHHSLIQWTAGIRLAMFEHSTLQEAYTGALIAGKGKTLNNINLIMDRARVKTEEWVRVRFGAGVPWRRCWCVISPPDEKEYQKLQKDLKKRSPYDRSHVPLLKGDIKFYDTRKEGKKQKKALPIASITDAYSAYAIYPQAKSLIDMSTLIKIEGNITIHSDPPSSTEGFVFMMPEVHPAVSGFEMLLRFLFPTWDTFCLYGRPGRLVASVLDPRSLMFAMPKHKRYGYLEILDVTGLILTEGSSSWSEREWRKKLKELTGRRMNAMEDGSKTHERSSSRNSKRLSFGPQPAANPRPRVNFADDTASARSSRSMSLTQQPGFRTDSAPPPSDRERVELPTGGGPGGQSRHARNVSDTQLVSNQGYEGGFVPGPGPGPQVTLSPPSAMQGAIPNRGFVNELAATPERVSSEDERPYSRSGQVQGLDNMARMATPEPVSVPPAFAHPGSSKPAARPYHSPEMRRANSRLSSTTLSQLAKAGGVSFDHHNDEFSQGSQRPSFEGGAGMSSGQIDPRGPSVGQTYADPGGFAAANATGPREALNLSTPGSSSGSAYQPVAAKRSKSPLRQAYQSPEPATNLQNYQSPRPSTPSSAQELPAASAGQRPPQYAANTNAPPSNWNAAPPAQSAMAPPSSFQAFQPRGSSLATRPTPSPNRTVAPLRTSGSVNRKPLPQRTTSLQRSGSNDAPPTPSSTSSLNRTLEESVLAQVHPLDGRGSPRPEANIRRKDTQKSEASSNYDNGSIAASPIYGNPLERTDTQGSVERPRAGVLKTVGDSAVGSGGSAPPPPVPAREFGIPEVDFGPTPNYGGRPAPQKRNFTPPGAPPTANAPTSGVRSDSRQGSDDAARRNVAWQPGGVTVGSASGSASAISAEQFVQQRLAAATTPLYSHQRVPSSTSVGTARDDSSTPPIKRTSSQDYLNEAGRHSRASSSELSQQGRPASQTGYYSTSAAPVGAADARERERSQSRQGYGPPAVQQPANPRQQAQQQALQAAQAAYAPKQPSLQQPYQSQYYRQPSPNPGYSSPPPRGRQSPAMGNRRPYPPNPGQGLAPQQPGGGAMSPPPLQPQQYQQLQDPPQGYGAPPGWHLQGPAGSVPGPQQGYPQGAGYGLGNPMQRPGPPPQGQYASGPGRAPMQYRGQEF